MLAKSLLESGRRVSILDRADRAHPDLSAGADYLVGDYSDQAVLRKAMSGAEEVVHLAGGSVPQSSFDDPVNDLLSNVPASIRLFQISCELQLKKFIFVSSGGTVYGHAKYLLLMSSIRPSR